MRCLPTIQIIYGCSIAGRFFLRLIIVPRTIAILDMIIAIVELQQSTGS